MKKRIGIILLSLFLIVVFSACSNGKTAKSTTKNTTVSTTELKNEEISTTKNSIEKNIDSIIIKVNNKVFTAKLYDNETAKAFAELLPITLDMNELNGNEKYYNLKNSLPTNASNMGKISNGDLMLYGNNCIVLFYDSFSTNYSYTKIGYIENPEELANTVGNSNITITFDK